MKDVVPVRSGKGTLHAGAEGSVMLRALRKAAVFLIYSNPITRAILRRLALDERSLADLLSTDRIRYRIQCEPEMRRLLETLEADTSRGGFRASGEGGRRVPGKMNFEDLYTEPGLGTLHKIVSDQRAIALICADRALLRRLLRDERELRAVADEVAQHGPLLREILLAPRAQKALCDYFVPLAGKRGPASEACRLIETLTMSGALEIALESNGPLAAAVRKTVLGEDPPCGADAGPRPVSGKTLKEFLDQMAAAAPETQRALADVLRHEWVLRVLSDNEGWCRSFLQRPMVMKRAAHWDAFVAAFLSNDDTLDRVAENKILLERLLSRSDVQQALLSSPALLHALTSNPHLVTLTLSEAGEAGRTATGAMRAGTGSLEGGAQPGAGH